MRKIKKNDTSLRVHHPYLFLLFWLGGLALGVAIVQRIVDVSLLQNFPRFWQDVVIGMSLGTGAGFGQALALRLSTGRWIRGWVPLTIIGFALGGGMLNLSLDILGTANTPVNIAVQAFLLCIIAALGQAWLLRKHMQRVWLWVLAVAAGASITGGIVSGQSDFLSVLFGFLGYGAVTGMTMIALINSARPDDERPKHDDAAAQAAHDRLNDTIPADMDDDRQQPSTRNYSTS